MTSRSKEKKNMANEIDLYRDLEFCEKKIKQAKDDSTEQDAWISERNRVVQEIKTRYPDLIF